MPKNEAKNVNVNLFGKQSNVQQSATVSTSTKDYVTINKEVVDFCELYNGLETKLNLPPEQAKLVDGLVKDISLAKVSEENVGEVKSKLVSIADIVTGCLGGASASALVSAAQYIVSLL